MIWNGFSITTTDFYITRACDEKYDKQIIERCAKQFRELEAQGEYKDKFKNTTEKIKYIIGMARSSCDNLNVGRRAALLIIYGPPFKSGELPRMRFNLDEEEAALERIASGNVN